MERRLLVGGAGVSADRGVGQSQRRVARAAVMTSCEFWAELLVTTLRYRGIAIVARPNRPESLAISCADRRTAPDVLVRLLTLEDYPVDLEEFHVVRGIAPRIGIVVLVAPLDLRLVGMDRALLPQGTQLASFKHPGGIGMVASVVLAAFRQPMAPLVDPSVEQQSYRLPLTDEQVEVLRAVGAGLSNEQIAKLRFTTVGAVRNIITRTATSLGVGAGTTPSVVRAQLASAYLQLLAGVGLARIRETRSST